MAQVRKRRGVGDKGNLREEEGREERESG